MNCIYMSLSFPSVLLCKIVSGGEESRMSSYIDKRKKMTIVS